MLSHFSRLFTYHNWANRRALDAIAGLDGNDEVPRKLMAHTLAAQKLWLLRINGGNLTGAQVWPELTFEECQALDAEMQRAWREFLNSLDADALARPVAYTNSKGESYINTVEEIITHTFNHATYHRGQIATKVKEAGGTPPVTDYIVFIRE